MGKAKLSLDWTVTQLRNVLTLSSDFHEVKASAEYDNVGMYSFGRGLFRKPPIDGAQTSARELNRIRSGQFIYSRLFAFEGAYGVVPSTYDGSYVSNEYPTFDINSELILPDYLRWWFLQERVWRELSGGSKGMGSRRQRIQPDAVLSATVPLLPIEEQRQIVHWLDSIDSRRQKAFDLISTRTDSLVELGRSYLFPEASTYNRRSFSDILHRQALDVVVEPDAVYQFAGVFSFGRGMFVGKKKRGDEFAYTELTRVKTNQFCYPKLMAWEGAFSVVPPECDGMVVSPEFPAFRIEESIVLPEVIEAYFRLPETWKSFADDSHGTNLRRRRLNPSDLLASSMPVPSMDRQLQFRAMLQRAQQANRLLDDVEGDLKALVPSALAQVFG